jgi:hypothetical protein
METMSTNFGLHLAVFPHGAVGPHVLLNVRGGAGSIVAVRHRARVRLLTGVDSLVHREVDFVSR